LRLLWRAQFVFGGIALFAGGFYLASSLNAQDPNNRPNDRTLLPSKFAIEQQERFQPVYGSSEDYHSCIKELRAVFKAKEGGGERVSVDEEDLTSHGISDWSYHDEKRPNVVVWVKSTEEVQEVVLLARRHKVPITPFSGGTSLEGHFSSVRKALGPGADLRGRSS
jgi:D-lactate dehydrogenase (cytochrome)